MVSWESRPRIEILYGRTRGAESPAPLLLLDLCDELLDVAVAEPVS
jgi:hypothetical protein